ncbi:hypothetical protein [Sphingobium sp. BYY-5]|nr:hypothetical protein [Sphingobium sp. BYY-5]
MTDETIDSFELEDLDTTILPGGSTEPVIHLPAVAVIFYWMFPA